MLVLSGLSLGVGCGSDGGDDKGNANGDGDADSAGDGDGDGTGMNQDPATGDDADAGAGDGDGDIMIDDPSAGGDKYPMCPRADIPAPTGYEGPKPFSVEDYQACATKCGTNTDCFFTCPGAQEWATCAQDEAIACTSKPKGICEAGYKTAICCQNEPDVLAECNPKPDAEKGDCFYNKCKADFDAFFNMCVFDKSKPDAAACFMSAQQGCFGNDPDPMPTDPGAGGMPIVKPSANLHQFVSGILEGRF
jgi:hypothetical protein